MVEEKAEVVIGIAECPTVRKLYGVRTEIRGNSWEATWAFPIKKEVAEREGYKKSRFPKGIRYNAEYKGCPYCEKVEDLAEISRNVRTEYSIAVSEPGCDDIGSILDSMGIKYEPYSAIRYNCDILFINCLTSDEFDSGELKKYVEEGGCLYASCYADEIVKPAFREMIESDHSGSPHKELVLVEDEELKEIVGNSIMVEFDTAWAQIYKAYDARVILRSSKTNLPIMISANRGNGMIFFTCFHNRAQASEKEHALLQLMVLRQIGANSGKSLEAAGREFGVDVDRIKATFQRDL